MVTEIGESGYLLYWAFDFLFKMEEILRSERLLSLPKILREVKSCIGDIYKDNFADYT